jgi:hypothetical protein
MDQKSIDFMVAVAIDYFGAGYRDGLCGLPAKEHQGESYYIGHKQGKRHGA